MAAPTMAIWILPSALRRRSMIVDVLVQGSDRHLGSDVQASELLLAHLQQGL